jgi:hypothetical protein
MREEPVSFGKLQLATGSDGTYSNTRNGEGRVAEAFDLAVATQNVGAPSLRTLQGGGWPRPLISLSSPKSGCPVLAFFARAGIRGACASGSITLHAPETRSPSSPHSHARARLRSKDRNDNCSNPIPRACRPRRVAQAFDLAVVTEKWVPRPCVLCKGGNSRCLRKMGQSRYTPPKRDFRPALIHTHRSGFVQKIETITAPTPFLGRANQAPASLGCDAYISASPRASSSSRR